MLEPLSTRARRHPRSLERCRIRAMPFVAFWRPRPSQSSRRGDLPAPRDDTAAGQAMNGTHFRGARLVGALLALFFSTSPSASNADPMEGTPPLHAR